MKLLKHLWSFHQEQVKSAAQKSDEESEHVAEQFLNGEMDLDTFLSAYTQKRMVSAIGIYIYVGHTSALNLVYMGSIKLGLLWKGK